MKENKEEKMKENLQLGAFDSPNYLNYYTNLGKIKSCKMKNIKDERKIINRLITFDMLIVFILIVIYILFNLKGRESIIIGLAFISWGSIQFYLKDKVWYFWWTLIPARPIYVKLIGVFLIFLGIIFLIGGLIS